MPLNPSRPHTTTAPHHSARAPHASARRPGLISEAVVAGYLREMSQRRRGEVRGADNDSRRTAAESGYSAD